MNCFEARNYFVAFWQKTLDGERRAQLLIHLSQCETCDRSFRAFALTAPVLYSANEPYWSAGPTQEVSLRAHRSGAFRTSSNARHYSATRMLNRVLPAFVMAAAAGIALYLAIPPRVTFEDAIASANSNNEAAVYPPTDNFFGQELMPQGTTASDSTDD
jgi:hypothetical protein